MKRPTDNYILTRADAERISDAIRNSEQRIGHIKARHRRRVVLSGKAGGGKAGGGGTPNRNAWCAANAGSGKTILCWLDTDASEAVVWSSEATYNAGDIVTWVSEEYVCLSENQNVKPIGNPSVWEIIQKVEVNCTLFRSENLNQCRPFLSTGTGPMPVYKIGADWFSSWTFEAGREIVWVDPTNTSTHPMTANLYHLNDDGSWTFISGGHQLYRPPSHTNNSMFDYGAANAKYAAVQITDGVFIALHTTPREFEVYTG